MMWASLNGHVAVMEWLIRIGSETDVSQAPGKEPGNAASTYQVRMANNIGIS